MSQIPFFKYTQFFTNPVRLLVRESHAIFASIPRSETDGNKTNIIAISRRYRSIIHECVENLQREKTTVDHSAQIRTFKELEVVWNLCEILLLDISQAATLITHLRGWIKMHFDELSNEAKDILRELDAGTYRLNEHNEDETYWNIVLMLVLRGETKKAIQLLGCHYEFQRNDQMQLVASMLDSMPLSSQYIVHEFANKWTTWSTWCQRERSTGQFDNHPHLLNIVRLVSQDHTVYEELAPKCETWYHLMVAYLLYSDPCIRDTELADLCRQMISIYKKNHPKYSHLRPEPNQFDEIIISAFEYDLIAVIANCCSYLDDNWWFVTHFIDLLHSCDQLRMHQITESDKLRETFLQDYAATLFDDELLWPVGVSYLDSCPAQGSAFLEILLTQIPLSIGDEAKANKIISIAKKRGLNTIPRSVCLVMARNWLVKTTRLGDESHKLGDRNTKRSTSNKLPSPIHLSSALYWAIKSGDSPTITHISDQYLYYYCKTGTFPDKSIFDSLRILDTERLAFLKEYLKFREIMQEPGDKAATDAGNLIRSLLASKVYPRFFCRELLEDVKKVFHEESQFSFQPDKVLDLMRSIEEINRDDMVENDVDLRKNLVRSMARVLIDSSHNPSWIR